MFGEKEKSQIDKSTGMPKVAYINPLSIRVGNMDELQPTETKSIITNGRRPTKAELFRQMYPIKDDWQIGHS